MGFVQASGRGSGGKVNSGLDIELLGWVAHEQASLRHTRMRGCYVSLEAICAPRVSHVPALIAQVAGVA